MKLLHRLASCVAWLRHRSHAEQALDEELQAFVEMSADDKIRAGMAPAEARRRAQMELGGVEQVRQRVRTERHGAWLDEIGTDLRYAVRLFLKTPAFTFIVVLTLALGIGANTAIFSLIDALMLRWLPVRSPQELVQVHLEPAGERSPGESFSYPIVRALAERHDIFAGVAGFSGFTFEAATTGDIARVPGAVVTGGYYDTFGLSPEAGRLLGRQDDEPGSPLVAVISERYWDREFGRDPAAVGRVVRLNGVPATIVGVSPRGFTGANVGSTADITISVSSLPQVGPALAPLLTTGNFWLRVLARPRDGRSPLEVTTRLNAIWPHIADSLIPPQWPAAWRQAMAEAVFRLNPGGTGWTPLRDIYRRPLAVLMGAVAIVLLIACANVASLLLARASARQQEIAMRLAIGASRARILRQLLIESALLALAGAAGGLALAGVSSRFLVQLISTGRAPLTFDLSPNGHVLAFTSLVAVVTALLFGIAPALHTTAGGPAMVLKEDGRMSRSRSRLLPWLVSAQVALSMVLVAGAGLFVRTLQNLHGLDPGFDARGVLLIDLEGRRTAVPREILDGVRRVPGVVSAALTTHTPLSGSTWSEPAVPAGQPVPDTDNAFFVGAGPRFFETLQIPLLAGREFTESDAADGRQVAVVNDVFARRFLAGRNPIGEHLAATVRNQRRELEIVGVAGSTSAAGLRNTPPPTVYVAYAQLTGDFPTTVVIRAGGATGQVAADIQRIVAAKIPGALIDVHPLASQVAATLSQEQMLATLAAAFGFVALTLACVGVYGLLAYNVAQRTKEIGIRMALGARRQRIVTLVMTSGARLVLIGLAAGLPVAWAASHWIESLLFGLAGTDPAVIGGAMLLLIAAGQLAAFVPAHRASRVDSLAALRHN